VQGGDRAPRDPAGRCHALAHLIDVPARTRAYPRPRAAAAVGGEGGTQAQYGQHVEANLPDLHERLRTKRYRHQPLRRVSIPTAQGKPRPLGLSACEDPLVHDAGREVVVAL
jgi:RNA-directed DNA polymerase